MDTPEISALRDQLAALALAGIGDGRKAAILALVALDTETGLDDVERLHRRFALRSRIRQVIRNTFDETACTPDGHVAIRTVDGRDHLFRDGFWWNAEANGWMPWAGSMFGSGYHATKAEIRRRAQWLAEAEAAFPPLSWVGMEARKAP